MSILFQIDAQVTTTRWGYSTGLNKQRISQKWVSNVTANITDVKTRIIKEVGTPADDVTLTIFSGGTDPENGTSLSSVVVNGASFPSSGTAQIPFTPASPVPITNGTTYWFTWTRATLDDSNLYGTYSKGGSNGWVYVPADGGWELLSPATGWDIEVDGGVTVTDNSLFFAGD